MARRTYTREFKLQGQLEAARPLAARLEAIAEELMRLAGGLSLDTLRGQAEDAAQAV